MSSASVRDRVEDRSRRGPDPRCRGSSRRGRRRARRCASRLTVDQVVVAAAADSGRGRVPPVSRRRSPLPRSMSAPPWPFRLSKPAEPRRTIGARAAEDRRPGRRRRAVVAVAQLDLRDVLRDGTDAVLASTCSQSPLRLDAVRAVVEAQPAVRLGDRHVVHLAAGGLEGDGPNGVPWRCSMSAVAVAAEAADGRTSRAVSARRSVLGIGGMNPLET